MLITTQAPDLLFQSRDFLSKRAYEFTELLAAQLLWFHPTRIAHFV